ncbi:uncharacterized protein G2W53_035628 [Senna tora]|uniref:Uncharacterized protein n=1 Tax=Senna tora TaxID=362788 RepID=A0A834SQS3_9FABA|nr:uncharacterized protein G2W53_035628 [Senna tora]
MDGGRGPQNKSQESSRGITHKPRWIPFQ